MLSQTDRALQDWWAQHTRETNLRNLATLKSNAYKFSGSQRGGLSPRAELSPRSKLSPRGQLSPRNQPVPLVRTLRSSSPRALHPEYLAPAFRTDPQTIRKKAETKEVLPPIGKQAEPSIEEQLAAQISKEEAALEAKRKAEELQRIISQVETGIYARHTNMYKAFQTIDLDRSGRLDKKEIMHAMKMWNVPLDEDQVDQLMGACDQDADGGISYEEFCDKLVRETVMPAAMGKRGMQSKEAMGVDGQEWLAKALGHGATPINTKLGTDPGEVYKKMQKDKELQGAGVNIGGLTSKEVRDAHYSIMQKFKERFSGIRQGFLSLDDDADGFISRPEFCKCLQMLNLDQEISPETVDALCTLIDVDQNEQFDYAEFQRFCSSSDVINMDNSRLKPVKVAPKQPKNVRSNRGHGSYANAGTALQINAKHAGGGL